MAQIEGLSGQVMVVDSAGRALVNVPLLPEQAGWTVFGSQNDPGTITGEQTVVSPESSHDFRLRVEQDSLLDFTNFSYTAQDTGKHIYRNTTMTNTWSGGFLNTNGGAITTLSTGTLLQTYQHFALFGAAEIYCEIEAGIAGTWGATNSTIDVGLFAAASTHPYAPTDGVFFRFTGDGVRGVVSYNGVEQSTDALTSNGATTWLPTVGAIYSLGISASTEKVEFWIDLEDGQGTRLAAVLHCPIGNPQPIGGSTVPFAVRHAIGGTAASAVTGLKIGRYTISRGGFQDARAYAQAMAQAGLMGYQGLAGGTMGSTALYTNSLAPGAGAALTGTTAAAGTGLGGQFSVLPTLTANSDGILCSYQNPLPTPANAGRQLVITGVRIMGIVTTVLVGGPLYLLHSLAFGHTAVSLATSEAATAKAPRRIPIGIQQLAAAAAVGAQVADVAMQFLSPVVINPGEYVAIATKNIGTVTTSGVVTFLVAFDAHWAA